MIADFALPQRDHAPAQCLKGLNGGSVSLDVACQLRKPVFAANSWHASQLAARVLVPEATVYLDDRPMPQQDDIRLARQVASMQAKSVAHGMKAPAHVELRLRILLPIAPHDLRARCRNGSIFRIHPISHDCAAGSSARQDDGANGDTRFQQPSTDNKA